jgi:4-amino-4-deoxy-L-arabinose transferase-like glycosyltransferase
VAPWLILVSAATEGTFLGEAIRSDLLPKLIGGQESHGAPPGYYLALLAVTAWPASLFIPLGLAAAWKGRGTPALRFALAWVVPGWIMFEAVPTKLPHYVMPLYPTLILLAAHAAVAGLAAVGRWRWAMDAWTVIWASVGLVLGGLGIVATIIFGDGVSLAALAAAAAAMAAIAAAIVRSRRDAPEAVAAALAGAVVVFGLLFALVLPRLDGLWLGRTAAALLAREGVPASRAVTVGYSEPSLVFLAGTDIAFANVYDAIRRLASDPASVILVGDRDRPRFVAITAALGLDLAEGPSIRGFNYSRGRWTELTLYRRR